MERISDVLRGIYRTTRVSDEPVAHCQFCGRPLYMVQLELKGAKGWIAVGEPYVEECDCEEAQRIRKEDDKKRLLKAIAEQKRTKIQYLLKKSGLGKRFQERTFAKWDKSLGPLAKVAYDKAWHYAKNWWDNYKAGRGLYIHGPYGTGKTHLAAAIVNYVIQTYEVPVLFGTLTVLFQHMKDAIVMGDSYRLEKERETLYTVDLLVIDDLGKERPTDWVVEELFNLINYRYEHMKPIIITSNYNPDELKQRYNKASRDYGEKDIGSAIISRLKEMCDTLPLFGEDYRKGGGE